MFYTHLFLSILLPQLASAIFFDVKRYAAEPKDGDEPYRPLNYFLNKQRKRSICLFMFCWRHYGNCRSSTNCCECKCKNRSTYFSEPLGCKRGRDMTNMTKDVGKGCYFATKKFGFEYVPLFHNQSRFVDIELSLPRRNFQLNDNTTVCEVGAIHDHDYHGHKLLYNRNHCSELFQVHQKEGKQYLQFHSTNTTIWNSLRGRLLSLDIECYSQRLSRTFSSCFLFQVEGKYNEEVDGEPPPEIPDRYVCPTAKSTTTDGVLLTTEATTMVNTTTSTTNTITLGRMSIHVNRAITNSASHGNGTTAPLAIEADRTTATPVIYTKRKSTTSPLRTTSSPTTLQNLAWTSVKPSTTLQPSTHAMKLPTTVSSTTILTVTKHTSTFEMTTQVNKDTTSTSATTMQEEEEALKTTKVIKKEEKSPKTTKVTVIFLEAKDTMTSTTIGILTGLGTGLAIVMICVIIWILIKKRKYVFLSPRVNTQIFNHEVNPFEDTGYYYDVPNVTVKPIDIIPNRNLPISHTACNRVQPGATACTVNDDISNSDYCRPYSFIEEKEGLDDQGFRSRENSILLNCRGNSLKNSMSRRPLPEKPMESGNPYYSASLMSETKEEDEDEDENDLYSLYSTIDDLKGSI